MIGWSLESIRKYSPRRLVIPVSMTVTEAFQQVGAGAHFAKLMGTDLGFVRKFRAAATFDFCPIFCTGGVDLERIPEAVSAGAVLTGAGFDVILKGQAVDSTSSQMAEILKSYVRAAQEARDKKWPQLADAKTADRQAWLDALPHHHHF